MSDEQALIPPATTPVNHGETRIILLQINDPGRLPTETEKMLVVYPAEELTKEAVNPGHAENQNPAEDKLNNLY